MILKLILLLKLSQWSFIKRGVICENLGSFYTSLAAEFLNTLHIYELDTYNLQGKCWPFSCTNMNLRCDHCTYFRLVRSFFPNQCSTNCVGSWNRYHAYQTLTCCKVGVRLCVVRTVARIFSWGRGGGAYLKNRDQIINVWIIHYATSEDSRGRMSNRLIINEKLLRAPKARVSSGVWGHALVFFLTLTRRALSSAVIIFS